MLSLTIFFRNSLFKSIVALLGVIICLSYNGVEVDAQPEHNWVDIIGSPGSAGDIIKSKFHSDGYIYTAGSFAGDSLEFSPPNGFDVLYNDALSDGFISKRNLNGDLIWVKQLKGSSDVCISDFVIKDEDLYLTGFFFQTVDFDPGPGTHYETALGYRACFLLKIDTDGVFDWVNVYHSTGLTTVCQSTGIDINLDGETVVTGYFVGNVDFDPSETLLSLSSSFGDDAFLMKSDSLGNLLWVKTFDDDGLVQGRDVKYLSNGDVVTVGSFEYNVDFNPEGSGGQTTMSAVNDYAAFILKTDGEGEFQYVKTFGADDTTVPFSVAVDDGDNFYISGFFEGDGDFDPGEEDVNFYSIFNTNAGFVSKFNSGGEFQWVRKVDGTGMDRSYFVDENEGLIYMAGIFRETVEFDENDDSMTITNPGNANGFVVCYDDNGNTEWVLVTGRKPMSVDVNDGLVLCSGIFNYNLEFVPGDEETWVNTVGVFDIFTHLFGTCEETNPSVSVMDDSLISEELGFSYEWLDCDVGFMEIQGEQSQSFTPLEDGNFAVVVFEEVCSDTSSCVIFNGIGEFEKMEKNIQVFPNPFEGRFVIESKVRQNQIQFFIFNTLGQLVKEGRLNEGSNQISMPPEKGLYRLTIPSLGYSKSLISK